MKIDLKNVLDQINAVESQRRILAGRYLKMTGERLNHDKAANKSWELVCELRRYIVSGKVDPPPEMLRALGDYSYWLVCKHSEIAGVDPPPRESFSMV